MGHRGTDDLVAGGSMARVVYVNGTYEAYADAVVHAEDRGFQFADGIYEVCEVRGGRLVDEKLHIDRLYRSLGELRMDAPMSRRALGIILRETVRRNRVREGHVYLQITRGAAKRDFAFPSPHTRPTVVCYARNNPLASRERKASRGVGVVTMPDIRWRRPDIKSVALLPNALARQKAEEAGASEAWLVDDNGFVTEGAACNAWIVTADNDIITRPAESGILRGVTRTVLIEGLRAEGLTLIERAFTVEEAQAAREAFNSSAVGLVMPVVSINGQPVGEGHPGPVAKRLRQLFHGWAEISSSRSLLR
jgi:D-alanine transaminase